MVKSCILHELGHIWRWNSKFHCVEELRATFVGWIKYKKQLVPEASIIDLFKFIYTRKSYIFSTKKKVNKNFGQLISVK